CSARLRRRSSSAASGRVANSASWVAVSEGASRSVAQAAASELTRAAAQNRTAHSTAALHLGPWSARRTCRWHSCAAWAWTVSRVRVYWQGRMALSWFELARTSHYQEGPCDRPAHHPPPPGKPESTEPDDALAVRRRQFQQARRGPRQDRLPCVFQRPGHGIINGPGF